MSVHLNLGTRYINVFHCEGKVNAKMSTKWNGVCNYNCFKRDPFIESGLGLMSLANIYTCTHTLFIPFHNILLY